MKVHVEGLRTRLVLFLVFHCCHPVVRAQRYTSASAVPKMSVPGRSEDVIFFDGVFFDGVFFEPSLKPIFFVS